MSVEQFMEKNSITTLVEVDLKDKKMDVKHIWYRWNTRYVVGQDEEWKKNMGKTCKKIVMRVLGSFMFFKKYR